MSFSGNPLDVPKHKYIAANSYGMIVGRHDSRAIRHRPMRTAIYE